MGKIWAIVLAAGESKRMGFPKMLLKFNGITMLETVIKNISDSEVDNIMIILGADRDLLSGLVQKHGIQYFYNDRFKEGMLSSVKCGFRNLPSDTEAVLVFQGDQPLIIPEVINLIIREYKGSDKGIVIPVHKGRRGHPLLVDKKYIDKIDELDDGDGLRSLAQIFSDDVLEIETLEAGILRDFDTFEDYNEEINQKR